MSLVADKEILIFHAVPAGRLNTWARYLLIVTIGSCLIAFSSKVQVPFYPVPMTLQTMVVLMLGMALGWRLAGATLLLYLAEGALGLPVFAGTPEKGVGFSYMLGSTGGYLFGFLVAATVCGWLAERGWGHSFIATAGCMVIGNSLIYMFGVSWLGAIFGWDKPLLSWGVFPFLWGDLLKIILAAIIMPLAWKVIAKR